jgi:hypothetical protein
MTVVLSPVTTFHQSSVTTFHHHRHVRDHNSPRHGGEEGETGFTDRSQAMMSWKTTVDRAQSIHLPIHSCDLPYPDPPQLQSGADYSISVVDDHISPRQNVARKETDLQTDQRPWCRGKLQWIALNPSVHSCELPYPDPLQLQSGADDSISVVKMTTFRCHGSDHISPSQGREKGDDYRQITGHDVVENYSGSRSIHQSIHA